MKVIFKVASSKAEEERRDAVNNNRQPAINRPRNLMEENENVRPIETVSSFRTGLDQSVKGGLGKSSLIKEEECHTSEKMIQVKIHSGTQQSTRVAALL